MSQSKKLGILAGGVIGAVIAVLLVDVATNQTSIPNELCVAFVLGVAFLGAALGSWVGKDDRNGLYWSGANRPPDA